MTMFSFRRLLMRARDLRGVYPSKLLVGAINDVFHHERHDLRRMIDAGVDVDAMRNAVRRVSAEIVEKVTGTEAFPGQNILDNLRRRAWGVILTERIVFVAGRSFRDEVLKRSQILFRLFQLRLRRPSKTEAWSGDCKVDRYRCSRRDCWRSSRKRFFAGMNQAAAARILRVVDAARAVEVTPAELLPGLASPASCMNGRSRLDRRHRQPS